MFTLKEEHLKRLCQLNFFPIPSDDMIFFGLRGCLPIQVDKHEFSNEHQVEVVETDYIHPRCTFGQWCPGKGIALFPGSTIPHKKHVRSSLRRNGQGTNQLMTGYYDNYRKGMHKAGRPTGHSAFRQDYKLPVRRTGDDLDYDQEDRVEFTRPYDNLHAGWCMGIDHDNYASAGCQVVVGYPKCAKRENNGRSLPDSGPWKVFKGNAYNITQKAFYYILLLGRDAQRIAMADTERMQSRLRYGSKGDLVKELQEKLEEEGFYDDKIDGDFGGGTLRAVLDFQTANFGSDADDGIVGPTTASALGLNLPYL
ncbi:MAG: hypothetical protein F6K19_02295 [Cyanothece sp. SIO1E1]|nr:hypothetical protein [Cyanothece sp. SIO1E1]